GMQNGIIDLAHAWLSWFPKANSTRQVGAIALVASAHVDSNQLACLNSTLPGMSMGHRTIGARSHNRDKRGAVRAQLDHLARDLPLQLFLRHSRPYPVADPGKCLIGNGYCLLEQEQLLGLLGE